MKIYIHSGPGWAYKGTGTTLNINIVRRHINEVESESEIYNTIKTLNRPDYIHICRFATYIDGEVELHDTVYAPPGFDIEAGKEVAVCCYTEYEDDTEFDYDCRASVGNWILGQE